jgi:MATE family multidrug resistance protein
MVKEIEHTKKSSSIRFQELVLLEDQDDRERLQQPGDSTSTSPTSNNNSSTFVSTCIETLSLALPLAVSRLSWTTMKTTDTALIGHTGTLNLSASAVADLYTQSTGVFINGWVLSTLVSHAFGSSNKQMGGIWLQVSLVVIGCLSMPVMISWLLCGPFLRAIGVSEELIRPAAYYALVLMAAIPARIGIGQLSQFLMAQRLANPLVQTGLFSMTINLILGLVLVLGIGVPGWDGFGFWVSPVLTVVVEWVSLFIYLYWFCYKKQLHKQGGCWPEDGFQWTYITSKRVKEYIHLYYPAALAGASDWWRVSAIGVVAVTFHDHASLAVFNSSYRIAWMSLIVIGSIGSAMGVLLGQELGKGDFHRAKSITSTCLFLALIIVLMLAAVFYAIPDKVAMIFSSDQEVIDLYEEVALPLTTMLIAMNLSVVLERVPLSCGRTQVVLWTGVVGSWVAQVPAVLLCTKFYRDDLYGLFMGVTCGYCALDILLLGVVYTTDWEFSAQEAKRRSEEAMVNTEMTELDEEDSVKESGDDKVVTTTIDARTSPPIKTTSTTSDDKQNSSTKYHSTSYNSIAIDNNNTFDEEESLW